MIGGTPFPPPSGGGASPSDPSQDAAISALQSGAAALDGRVTTLEGAPAPTDFTADITALQDADIALGDRVTALEDAPAPTDFSGDIAALQAADTAIDGRLDTLEALPAPTDYSGDIAALTAADTALDGRVTALEDAPSPTDFSADITALQDADTALDGRLDDIEGYAATGNPVVAASFVGTKLLRPQTQPINLNIATGDTLGLVANGGTPVVITFTDVETYGGISDLFVKISAEIASAGLSAVISDPVLDSEGKIRFDLASSVVSFEVTNGTAGLAAFFLGLQDGVFTAYEALPAIQGVTDTQGVLRGDAPLEDTLLKVDAAAAHARTAYVPVPGAATYTGGNGGIDGSTDFGTLGIFGFCSFGMQFKIEGANPLHSQQVGAAFNIGSDFTTIDGMLAAIAGLLGSNAHAADFDGNGDGYPDVSIVDGHVQISISSRVSNIVFTCQKPEVLAALGLDITPAYVYTMGLVPMIAPTTDVSHDGDKKLSQVIYDLLTTIDRLDTMIYDLTSRVAVLEAA